LTGLFAAGEDTGGVHGANRLGGNGVANSTVFGGLAGEAMAAWVTREGEFREADAALLEAGRARALGPVGRPQANLESIRERLFAVMWDDVGIVRDAAGLVRAQAALAEIDSDLDRAGIAGTDLRFNLTWHDWLNLRSLVDVSHVIAAAALARENSRGAHYRTDFPDPGELASSMFTSAQRTSGHIDITMKPVAFTRVKPGETLLLAGET
jgi:fumarate reductase flavoprotein subunit